MKNSIIKIGLVGEAPTDTLSIKNLMEKKYKEDYDFFFMLDRINGSQLDAQITKRFLRIEYETKQPDIIVFIRDLDSVLPNKEKLSERKQYFTNSNRIVDKKGIYLLHIYEIEAIILADIEVFNHQYNSLIKRVENPMKIEEPKEYLRSRVKEYRETDNPVLFKKIRFDKALKCNYFDKFIAEFDRVTASLK